MNCLKPFKPVINGHPLVLPCGTCPECEKEHFLWKQDRKKYAMLQTTEGVPEYGREDGIRETENNIF